MKIKELLPIGSIALLRGEDKRLMIVGVMQEGESYHFLNLGNE